MDEFEIKNRIFNFPYIAYGVGVSLGIFFFYQFIGYILYEYQSDNFLFDILKQYSQILFLLIPTLLLASFNPLGKKEIFRLRGVKSPAVIFLGIIGLIPIVLFNASFVALQEMIIPESFMHIYTELMETIEKVYSDMIIGPNRENSIFYAILIAGIIPGISEEFLFRGMMLRSLEEVLSPVKAIFISGLLFGMLHFNPIQLIPLAIIGIYLGFLACYTRSIILPFLVHFLNNVLSVALLYMADFNDSLESNSDALSIYILIATLIFSIIFLILIILAIKKMVLHHL